MHTCAQRAQQQNDIAFSLAQRLLPTDKRTKWIIYILSGAAAEWYGTTAGAPTEAGSEPTPGRCTPAPTTQPRYAGTLRAGTPRSSSCPCTPTACTRSLVNSYLVL